MPILEEGEICMSEQVASADSEGQVLDVNLRVVSGEAGVRLSVESPPWKLGYRMHQHGNDFAVPIQRCLPFASS